MPRTARASAGGICYHVINRGNAGAVVFRDDAEYQEFEKLLGQACHRLPMPILGYCLMPNHFHLVLWPREDGDLSRWMQWLLTAHVRRHHKRHGTFGHIWQGRFRAFPVQDDRHLLTVLRYVERNPLRANLVPEAQQWRWSSLRWFGWQRSMLAAGPVDRPDDWLELVNQPQNEAELAAIRSSIQRGSPFGGRTWTRTTAELLGLETSLRPRGRPAS
ncbi:MAG: transposase [Phycisphaerae bacterium]|nr:transposase [Phycisphaerae bacterium]